MNAVGLTSRWIAASRALETERESGLFKDPYARALAGEEGFALHAEFRGSVPGAEDASADPYLVIRTRFLDDALQNAVVEGRITQVVSLASGMDSRAFRLLWPPGLTFFEIDQELVIDSKEGVLNGLGAVPACKRVVLRADLREDWRSVLEQAGFDRSRPSAFLVEGLFPYLDEQAVHSVLEAISDVAHTGSWIGLDMAGIELLQSPFMTPFLARLERLGCPWKYGVKDPEGLLTGFGWKAKAVCPGELEANFGRWPYPVMPRSFPGIPRSYLITAWRE